MTGTAARHTQARLPVVLAALALAAITLVLAFGAGGPRSVLVAGGLGRLLFAAAACASLARCARHAAGRLRQSWIVLAAGCGAWAGGQTVSSWYVLVLGRSTPLPSAADLGLLAFPLAASVALVLHPAFAGRADGRRLLDGLTVAAALGLVSWSTALGAAVHAGSDGALASAVLIASRPATWRRSLSPCCCSPGHRRCAGRGAFSSEGSRRSP